MKFHEGLLHDVLHADPNSSESVRMIRAYTGLITTGAVEVSLWHMTLITASLEQKLGFLGMANPGTCQAVLVSELQALRDHLARRIAAAREAAIKADQEERRAALHSAEFYGQGEVLAH